MTLHLKADKEASVYMHKLKPGNENGTSACVV